MIMAYIIILDEQTGYNNVCEARQYQADALNDYIVNGFTEERKYSNFSIAPFNSISSGLQGEYLDVYQYINEDRTICLISCNFKKLSALCGYINRTTGPM